MGLDRFGKELERYHLPFGLSGKPTAQLIVALELCAAVLLLTGLYPAGAALAALLAAGFGFAVSGVLARGERFACQCFGTAVRITVSPSLFALDLLLFASAVFLLQYYLWENPTSPLVQLVLLVACTLVIGLGGQAARIAMTRRTRMGLSTGKTAPQFSARTLAGTSVDSVGLYTRQAVLVFVTPGCPACDGLLTGIARTWNGRAEFLVVGTSDTAGMRRLMQSSELPATTVLDGADAPRVRELFRMRASPAAVILARGRVVGKLIPANVKELSRIVGEMNGRH